jgi:hypothetical protein
LGILTHTRLRKGSSEIIFVLINGRAFTFFENRDGWAMYLSTLQFITFCMRAVSLESPSLKCFTQLYISETVNVAWLFDLQFPEFESYLSQLENCEMYSDFYFLSLWIYIQTHNTAWAL